MRFLPASLTAICGLTAFASAAQNQASLASYVSVIQGDSVAFHYGLSYEMQQPACATVRRLVRLDQDGSFHGVFRDVRVGDTLVATGTYQHGRKEGLFTTYHLNGQVAARGHYQQNQRTGDWEYWYPSGQRRQILHFEANGQPTVRAYWTATGVQQVQDGNGVWHQTDSFATIGGPVVEGHATGEWHRTAVGSGKLMTTETFDAKGHFRQGRLVGMAMPGSEAVYRDESRMPIAEELALVNAEKYVLHPPCNSNLSPTKATNSSNFVPATYKQGLPAYWEMIWIRLRPMLGNGSALGNYHGVLRFTVNLDATGNWQIELYKTEGVDLEAARQLLKILRVLPRWEPAQLAGAPVASSVEVEYQAIEPQYRLRFYPKRGTVDSGFSTPPTR
jgi:hypothetical protein